MPDLSRRASVFESAFRAGIRVVGLNYKDDRQKAIGWLNTLGNPYALSLF